MTITAPIRLVSEANLREHWAKKSRRRKAQQQVISCLLWCHRVSLPKGPGKVRLTRLGPKRFDADNNAGSFKHVQDAIARHFNVDDGDPRWQWQYEQEKAKEYGVRLHFSEDQ